MTKLTFVLLLGAALATVGGCSAASKRTESKPRVADHETKTAAGFESQSDMNVAAYGELRAAESEMAAVLACLHKKGAGHADALAKLDRAQSAWVIYRDAHVDALWPSETRASYGSVHPMCVALELKELTTRRTAELRKMLKPEEGEVCFGDWPE